MRNIELEAAYEAAMQITDPATKLSKLADVLRADCRKRQADVCDEGADEIMRLRALVAALAEKRITVKPFGDGWAGYWQDGEATVRENGVYPTQLEAAEAAFVKMQEATA